MSTKDSDKEREARQFTERTLLSLANDLVALEQASEAIVTKIRAVALAHRIDLQSAA